MYLCSGPTAMLSQTSALQTCPLQTVGYAPSVWLFESGTSPKSRKGESYVCSSSHMSRTRPSYLILFCVKHPFFQLPKRTAEGPCHLEPNVDACYLVFLWQASHCTASGLGICRKNEKLWFAFEFKYRCSRRVSMYKDSGIALYCKACAIVHDTELMTTCTSCPVSKDFAAVVDNPLCSMTQLLSPCNPCSQHLVQFGDFALNAEARVVSLSGC